MWLPVFFFSHGGHGRTYVERCSCQWYSGLVAVVDGKRHKGTPPGNLNLMVQPGQPVKLLGHKAGALHADLHSGVQEHGMPVPS